MPCHRKRGNWKMTSKELNKPLEAAALLASLQTAAHIDHHIAFEVASSWSRSGFCQFASTNLFTLPKISTFVFSPSVLTSSLIRTFDSFLGVFFFLSARLSVLCPPFLSLRGRLEASCSHELIG